jgi:hypothetical protein
MSSDYFVPNIFIPLEQVIFLQGKAPHQKRPVIHLDNCSVHTSPTSTDFLEQHGMRRIPCPPYSLDLARVTSTRFR